MPSVDCSVQLSELLNSCRQEIDAIDREILQLLEQRTRIAMRIGALKKHQKKNALIRLDREKAITERLVSASKVLSPYSVQCVWREIISTCRGMEGQINIAYCSNDVDMCLVKHIFGGQVGGVPCGAIDDVLVAIQSAAVEAGLLYFTQGIPIALPHHLEQRGLKMFTVYRRHMDGKWCLSEPLSCQEGMCCVTIACSEVSYGE